MEYIKKIKLLSGLIVILIVLYVIGTVFSSGNLTRKKSLEQIFDKSGIEKISAIKVDLENGNILLTKKDNKWSYIYNNKEYPASADKIDNFIDSISKLTKHQISGSDSKSWEKFDLVEGKSKNAVFYDSSNKELFALYVGKSGPVDGGGEYIRISLSDESYLTDGSIIRYFIRDRNYWSNLRVLPEDVDSNTIASVKIKTDKRFSGTMAMMNFTMKKEFANNSLEWKDAASGKVIDKNSADMLLNNIASLTGDSFSENYITDKNCEIELETDKYGRIIIDVKVLEKQNVLFAVRGGNYIYEAALYKIERILNSAERINDELK